MSIWFFFFLLFALSLLSFTFGLENRGWWWVAVPIPLSLVDEPIVDLFQLQPCFLNKPCLLVLLIRIHIKKHTMVSLTKVYILWNYKHATMHRIWSWFCLGNWYTFSIFFFFSICTQIMTLDAQLCIRYYHDLAEELISSQSFICTHIYTEVPKRQDHEFEPTTYVKNTKLLSIFLRI